MMNNLKLLSIVVCFLGISLFSCSSDDSKVEAELIVAKESLSFGNGAEMQKLAIKSNVDWQMSSSESWCVLSASSGKSGTHQIEVNVTANATNDTRQAVVTILAGSITKA
ncbi:MAG: BACON domain-containing protein, partial [Bacteroides graminisolvens]